MTEDTLPTCRSCQIRFSVQHIICKCPLYHDERLKYNISNNISKSLNDISHRHNVIQFFKEIGIFIKSNVQIGFIKIKFRIGLQTIVIRHVM